jgi:hypothetical protein
MHRPTGQIEAVLELVKQGWRTVAQQCFLFESRQGVSGN